VRFDRRKTAGQLGAKQLSQCINAATRYTRVFDLVYFFPEVREKKSMQFLYALAMYSIGGAGFCGLLKPHLSIIASRLHLSSRPPSVRRLCVCALAALEHAA
jgi:hypothetical protein